MSIQNLSFGQCSTLFTHPKSDTRVGGVYVLPLHKSEEGWTLLYNFAVLFEIDDQGYLDSHSKEPALSAYNGEHYTTLTRDLRKFIQDEDFMLSKTRFGQMYEKYTLILGTVTQKEEAILQSTDIQETYYTLRIDKDYNGSILDDDFALKTAIVKTSEKPAHMEIGSHYLIFIYEYDGYQTGDSWVCEIRDSKIVSAEGTFFEGFSYQQLETTIRKLDLYRGSE